MGVGEVGMAISVLERRAPLRVVVAGACRRASQSAVGAIAPLRTPAVPVVALGRQPEPRVAMVLRAFSAGS
jgi:hypothetical protein